jgi:hypothetical protein
VPSSAPAGSFVLDPAAGADIALVLGTGAADTMISSVDVSSTVQVNTLAAVSLPTANVERLSNDAGQGADAISVTAFDTVKNADQLTVAGGSPKAKFQQLPGGPTPGSGGVVVHYPQTTGNQTRIDYSGIGKLKIQH